MNANSPTAEFTYGVQCRYLSTLDPKRPRVEENVFIGVTDHTIAFIGTYDPAKHSVRHWISGEEHWVIPGLVNAHTHLPMTLLRGMADDEPLKDWLEKHIFPTEARLVSPEFVRLGTKLALAEAIRSGSTTFCDMYYFAWDIGQVCDEAGVRAYLGETYIDFPVADNLKQDGGEERILQKMMTDFRNHRRIRPVVGPHAPYTCSDDTLRRSFKFARENKLLVSVHVSETEWEQNESLAKYKKTPARRFYDLDLLDVPTLFAHGVHLTDDDMTLLAKTKTSVVYNPESNMKLGSGATRVPKLLASGVNVALGTDGCASNNDLNMLREMDTGAKLQKLSEKNNSAISAWQMLQLATINGAKALQGDKTFGSLEVGKAADFICVDLQYTHLQPIHDVTSLIYSLQGSEVSTVVCDGRLLMDEYDLKTLDEQDILDELDDYRKKMKF
jgi:5-methylthioadenosine/S-adenosylhomocysteine deaminase